MLVNFGICVYIPILCLGHPSMVLVHVPQKKSEPRKRAKTEAEEQTSTEAVTEAEAASTTESSSSHKKMVDRAGQANAEQHVNMNGREYEYYYAYVPVSLPKHMRSDHNWS